MDIDKRAKILLKNMEACCEGRIICDVILASINMDISVNNYSRNYLGQTHFFPGVQETEIKMNFYVSNPNDIENIQKMFSNKGKRYYLVEVKDE